MGKPSTTYYVTGQTAGPNAGCATPALAPLDNTLSTSSKSSPAVAAIGAAAGTSTIGAQQPKPYGYVDPKTTAVNHKVVILLTDGMNDWFGQTGDGYTQYTQYDSNKMVYNAFGYPQEGRLANVAPAGATPVDTARAQLDQTTLDACTAAKATKDPSGNAAPVEIYTVGFVATDGIDKPGRTLLATCATDSGHAFIAADGDGLVAVFQQIAAAIWAPRIQSELESEATHQHRGRLLTVLRRGKQTGRSRPSYGHRSCCLELDDQNADKTSLPPRA